jgi:hypothetical protein
MVLNELDISSSVGVLRAMTGGLEFKFICLKADNRRMSNPTIARSVIIFYTAINIVVIVILLLSRRLFYFPDSLILSINFLNIEVRNG